MISTSTNLDVQTLDNTNAGRTNPGQYKPCTVGILDMYKPWTGKNPGQVQTLDKYKPWTVQTLDSTNPGQVQTLDRYKPWTSTNPGQMGLGGFWLVQTESGYCPPYV